MLASRVLENALLVALTLLLVLNAASKAAIWACPHRKPAGDVPWHSTQQEVVIEWDSWTRYTLHSAAEWAALAPGDGVVHVGPHAHTPTMFHQLRCLDAVRAALALPRAVRDTARARHCMNYLRATSACHAATDFEPNQYVHEVNPVHPHPVHRCLDWRPLYEETRRNQEEYARRGGGGGNWTLGL